MTSRIDGSTNLDHGTYFAFSDDYIPNTDTGKLYSILNSSCKATNTTVISNIFYNIFIDIANSVALSPKYNICCKSRNW